MTSRDDVRPQPAVLVCADGARFVGRAFGATGITLGEAVFSTGMTGYQETMTDPSYHRQIVALTAPQIGNTGWNDEDSESRGDRIWVAGLVIRDYARRYSNWRAQRSLEDEMVAQGIVGIQNVDTRTLVRHLRSHGSVKAGIFSGDAALLSEDEQLERVRAQRDMAGSQLAQEVSVTEPVVVEPQGESGEPVEQVGTVIAYDMGIKSRTPWHLTRRGLRTVIAPADYPVAKALEFDPDGVFISNGPGDPATADTMVGIVREYLERDMPLFGICFGNQILGRALGLETYKLKFGHRGINVPVKDHVTERIEITAQNHGFALKGKQGEVFDTPYGPAQITHTCLNDDVVEGVALTSGRAFAVQYHPEAAAGPHDSHSLFDRFVELIRAERNKEAASTSTVNTANNANNAEDSTATNSTVPNSTAHSSTANEER